MNRRNFIFLTKNSNRQVVELSCETLYMHYMDILTANSIRESRTSAMRGDDWLPGEFPEPLSTYGIENYFSDLQSQLSGYKKLRLLDSSWIIAGLFKDKIDALLHAYRELGGELEIVNNIEKLNAESSR